MQGGKNFAASLLLILLVSTSFSASIQLTSPLDNETIDDEIVVLSFIPFLDVDENTTCKIYLNDLDVGDYPAENNTEQVTYLGGLELNTYYWYVECIDGDSTILSETYSFIAGSPPIGVTVWIPPPPPPPPPPPALGISFVPPTLSNGSITSNTNIYVNASIDSASPIDNVTFNWNGSKYLLLDDNLWIAYNFDDVSAIGDTDTHFTNIAGDLDGAGYNVAGESGFIPGVFGNAMNFSGPENTYILVAFDYASTEFTIQFWAFPNNDSNCTRWLSGGNKRAVISGCQPGNFNVYPYPTGDSADTNIPMSLNEWQRITITGDASRTYGYKNGVQIFNVSGSLSSTDMLSGYCIGSIDCNTGDSLDGAMDELRLWTRMLSPEEISQSMDTVLKQDLPSTWIVSANKTGLSTGTYSFEVSAANHNASNASLTNSNSTGIYYNTIWETTDSCTGASGTFECGDVINESCNLTGNIQYPGTCFVVEGDDVVLDFEGFTISGDGSPNSFAIIVNGSSNAEIRNCAVSNFTGAVYIAPSSSNNTFININAIDCDLSIKDDSGAGTLNYLIYNNIFGEIEWTDSSPGGFLSNLTFTGELSFPGTISIGNNSAYVQAGHSGTIGSAANITLNQIGDRGFLDPVILKNTAPCADCHNFTALDAETVIFNVTGFSNFSIGDYTNETSQTPDTSSWWMPFRDLNRSGYYPGKINEIVEPGVLWSYNATPDVALCGSIGGFAPIVFDDKVYAGRGRCVYAFELDGTLLWKREIISNPACYAHSIAATNAGALYLTMENCWACKVDASNGDPIYCAATGSDSRSNALVDSGIFVSNSIQRIYGLYVGNWTSAWMADPGHWFYERISVDNGRMYTGDDEGRIVSLYTNNGTTRWSTTLPSNGGAGAVSSDDIYYILGSGGLFALNASNGNQIWNFTVSYSGAATPALAHGRVYFGFVDSRFYALNATTGAHIWNTSIGASSVYPTITEDEVIFAGLTILNATTGEKIWERPVNNASVGSFIIVDGRLFTANGYMLYEIGNVPIPPSFSGNSSSTALVGANATFSLLVNDNYALNPNGYYVFSTNNSGVWVNDTPVSFTSTPQWANVSKILNDTPGLTIGYRWYLYDNKSLLNVTPIYELNTYDVHGCVGENYTFQCGERINQSCTFDINIDSNSSCFTMANNTNITVNCAGFNLTGNMNGTAFFARNITGLNIENCTIRNFTTVFTINNSANVLLSNSLIFGNRTGLGLSANSVNGLIVRNLSFRNFSTAMQLNYLNNSLITNNLINGNAGQLSGIWTFVVQNSNFTNNVLSFNNATESLFYISYSPGCRLENNIFDNNRVQNSGGAGFLVIIANPGETHVVDRNNFTNNTLIDGFSAVGVHCDSVSTISLTNNIFTGNTYSGWGSALLDIASDNTIIS
ncbi:PQQ-binding-like beta-propeller repeat protein, partial [Candidatus Micrarchaeota archaeon]|nr:PQQ-binding-like beta-propeller repeat protein [Candidatus Micrarchaeota archaeon]